MLNNTQNNTQNHSYIYGLDGLRALAIFFVVAYHFSFNWARGGFLGVDIFFVLSGYLVTSKILPLEKNKLDLNLKRFWCGRIRRLLPSVFAMIITTVVWVILFKREILTTVLGDAVFSIFYTTNWWFIFHKLSYFDSFGTPSPLRHLWFLAVQEQFHFIWPIVLITGLKFFKKRNKFSVIVFVGALCSAILMGIMYSPDIDPSRVYYGTDTRAFELLIGSCLALVLPMNKLSSKQISIKKKVLNIASIITLAVFILSAVFMDEYSAFLYRGGMLLFSFNTAILIVCVCSPSGFLSNLFSWKPLRWIGTRSYAIYLWHYPIMVLSTPIQEIGNPVYWKVILRLIVICIIAELSYRFIETPIRKLGVRRFYRKYLWVNIFNWGQLTVAKKFLAIISTSVVLVFTIGMTSSIKNEQNVGKIKSYPTEVKTSSTDEAVTDKDSEKASLENNSVSSDKSYKQVLAIGDSIMIDITPSLKKAYTNITIDGKIGRQMKEAIKLVHTYSSFNSTDNAVIIELGSNGYFTEKQIEDLLNYFSKADVYLVNTRVPRSWESKVNKALKRESDERENVVLIDWYSTAVKHPEYFESDGVHLKSSGSEALTNLISKTLNSK